MLSSKLKPPTSLKYSTSTTSNNNTTTTTTTTTTNNSDRNHAAKLPTNSSSSLILGTTKLKYSTSSIANSNPIEPKTFHSNDVKLNSDSIIDKQQKEPTTSITNIIKTKTNSLSDIIPDTLKQKLIGTKIGNEFLSNEQPTNRSHQQQQPTQQSDDESAFAKASLKMKTSEMKNIHHALYSGSEGVSSSSSSSLILSSPTNSPTRNISTGNEQKKHQIPLQIKRNAQANLNLNIISNNSNNNTSNSKPTTLLVASSKLSSIPSFNRSTFHANPKLIKSTNLLISNSNDDMKPPATMLPINVTNNTQTIPVELEIVNKSSLSSSSFINSMPVKFDAPALTFDASNLDKSQVNSKQKFLSIPIESNMCANPIIALNYP